MTANIKYNIGDIIQLKNETGFKRVIINVYYSHNDGIEHTNEIYYSTKVLHDGDYPPMNMKESVIDKYYIKNNE
jgi:hypothetical protein